MAKYVHYFGNGQAEGDASMKPLLGGKGSGLCEMTKLGVNVPPGFVISTETCKYFYDHDRRYPDGLEAEIDANVRRLEDAMGATLGGDPPLLVSVRSGAALSMPGMMDTVLNLGMNRAVLDRLTKRTGNARFAWDAYRRFIQMFGDVVMNVDRHRFEAELDAVKKKSGAARDTDLGAAQLEEVTNQYLRVYREATGQPFPEDPRVQLRHAIDAVFGSWMNERAVKYRQIYKITGLLGTAVTVQAMVFGNLGDSSGTGVCFTRDPATGENVFYGEFLLNAQGEDVVAGTRTPQPIRDLEKAMPVVYKQLVDIKNRLERHFHDVQDCEFTVQEGKLFILQTRTGKRTARAAVKIACDMVAEKMIDEKTATLRVDPADLDQLLHPTFDPKAKKEVIAKGIPGSPGAAVGRVVFTADEAEAKGGAGEAVILVRTETSPEDIGGMHAAKAILTARGGKTSHAAVVARGMGKCCVVGCSDITLDLDKKQFTARGGVVVKDGDWISVDGTSGEVVLGRVPTVDAELGAEFEKLLSFADKFRTLRVRANADVPADARMAHRFGAEGIGLCRTEHMFFEGDRILAVREMILANGVEERKRALAKLLPIQREDFVGIFREMQGLPVTIRLLDPPLHEFLPQEPEAQAEMARIFNTTIDVIRKKVNALHEFNPMMGHRGCRLGVTYPEVYDMQTTAIFEAACAVTREKKSVIPEIMIPLVGSVAEFDFFETRIRQIGKDVMARAGVNVAYLVGTMIEVPRAALLAAEIAKSAEFFSFGTNDLTQMTFGFSRDDSGTFLPAYLEHKILADDPFQTLDRDGVGRLVKLAVTEGRSARPTLKVGICGEHGGDPSSVAFCHEAGLNYVSCSPFRVPIARLAAAQAAIQGKAAKDAAL
ncbi:MAG: pyruvate, phosphate dikinase [Planctomycetes bacterium]|nr:pyruvate, phosphate dikinase [Planctomycetota bacterium]MBI3844597.1 pyruvate, phosphate dikinase [Planctomycetota bacterium]